MSDWQPIETVPKDGSEIVVAYGHQGFVKQLVRFSKIHGHWVSKGGVQIGLKSNATHWMPLPEPPSAFFRAYKTTNFLKTKTNTARAALEQALIEHG